MQCVASVPHLARAVHVGLDGLRTLKVHLVQAQAHSSDAQLAQQPGLLQHARPASSAAKSQEMVTTVHSSAEQSTPDHARRGSSLRPQGALADA